MTTVTFEMLRACAAEYHEKNDCTVKMVSLVSGIPYAEARELLAKHGRKPRRGCRQDVQRAALCELGYQLIPISLRGKTIRTLARTIPRDGTFLIYTRGHVSTAINGRIEDWAANKLKRILSTYQVIRKADSLIGL